MSESEVERRIERTRRCLANLRERSRREEPRPGSPLRPALEELGAALDELSEALEKLASDRSELAEARLVAEQHAQRYQELFRSTPDAYLVTDERGVLLALNPAAAHKLGGRSHPPIGEPLLPLVAASDRDRFLGCLSALRERRTPLEDVPMRFGGDPPFDASVSAVPTPIDGGIEIRWMLRDATEIRERHAFRDEIERHLEAVVWLLQLVPPRILHVSPAYEVVWGRPLASLYENPRDWLEQVHAEDRPVVEAALERLRQGDDFDVEYRILRGDGEVRWIHDRGTLLDEGRGHLDRAAGIAEDVTEKKQAEAALREAEQRRRAAALAVERAEASERRALASDLHDALSQSLALAQTKLAALRDEAGESERAARLRDIESLIAEAAERTRTLTFRLSPPVLHDLGLAAAADWLAEDLLRRFGLHVQIRESRLQEPLSLEIREALFRSLRELLINVARHAQTDKATVLLTQEGDTLTIVVEDGGVGFDIGRTGSAGFGLVSIRERLEALGGRLEIDSEIGRGTRARLIVPARREG